MTTASTALVMVGPSGVGSFHDRLWRMSPPNAQVVEGGSNGPYFLINNGGQEHSFNIEDFDTAGVVTSTVLAIALLTGDDHALETLRMSENFVQTDEGQRVAPYWEIVDEVFDQLVERLKRMCRVAVVQLDQKSIVNQSVLDEMRALGFDVEVFASTEEANGTAEG